MNTTTTTQTINGIDYTTVKRGHGTAVHLAVAGSRLTMCAGYVGSASVTVEKAATCKTCLRAASLWTAR